MKKLILFLFLIPMIIGCATTDVAEKPAPAGQAAPDAESVINSYDYKVLAKIDEGKLPRYVLAVVGDAVFIDEARIDLGEVLQNEINKSGRVTMVDRNNLAAIIEEQKFALSGLSDEGSVRLGELAGADYLIFTEIVSSSKQKVDKVVYDAMEVEVTVQVKLLDVSTGELFRSETAVGKAFAKLVTDSSGNLVAGALDYGTLYADAALNAVAGIIPPFIRSFPMIGFILKKGDATLDCDLGAGTGVKPGDRIAFIRRGEAIYHPVNKQLLSFDYTYLGYGTVEAVKSSSCTVALTDIRETPTAADIAVYIGP